MDNERKLEEEILASFLNGVNGSHLPKAKVKLRVLRQWLLLLWLKTSGSTFASRPATWTIFKQKLQRKRSLINPDG